MYTTARALLECLGQHGTFKSRALWSIRDGKGLRICQPKVKLPQDCLHFIHCIENHLLLPYEWHISVLTTHWFQCSNLSQAGTSSPVHYHQKNAPPLHVLNLGSWRECSPDQMQRYGSAETEAALLSGTEWADVQNICRFRSWIFNLTQV
jgi:hypothetical protein